MSKMTWYCGWMIGPFTQYHSCFISHSSKDTRFCDRLNADLKINGVRTWYFPEDARWGGSLWEEIDCGLNACDKLIVVCSRHSLTSGPVLREIERSLQREDDELRATGRAKHVLFPITLDRYLFDDWQHPRKADVLTKVVGTFQGWNRSAEKYSTACDRLLRSLQAAEPA